MGQHPENLRSRVFCSSCGASEMRRYGMAPLGWQEMSDKNGRPTALCPTCVRNNLWLIEARLEFDPELGF
jgi:hypothetical protein